jgi:hypothetical protein
LVLEGQGGHGLEGRISITSIGQKKQVQRGVIKSLEKRNFWGVFFFCDFLGKGRRRMRSLSRWWKEGEWVGCLGYFKRIKMSRIVLGA